MSSIKWVRTLSGIALLAAAPAYAADEPASVLAEAQTPIAAPLPAEPAATAAADEYELVGDGELTDLRGGDGMVLGDQTLVAVTTGNVINGDYTAGNVSLSDMALSNFNGFGNVLINTGAQVSLQTGMNVTINVGE
jgi:hypothetical protein